MSDISEGATIKGVPEWECLHCGSKIRYPVPHNPILLVVTKEVGKVWVQKW